MNGIELSIFSSRLEAVCDEMGAVLRNAAFSPNIRDRLDFSCAVFDASGELCAQAAHIPVHLGSMAFAMRDVVGRKTWREGDQIILNDPYLGGTHLPDVTLVAPVFAAGELAAFVVNRAHHADIGADTPGSMPISSSIEEEGLVLGGSSGINIAGAVRMAREMGPGHRIVTVLCDYGTRYQSKLFNPDFLKEKELPVPGWLDRAPAGLPQVFETD